MKKTEQAQNTTDKPNKVTLRKYVSSAIISTTAIIMLLLSLCIKVTQGYDLFQLCKTTYDGYAFPFLIVNLTLLTMLIPLYFLLIRFGLTKRNSIVVIAISFISFLIIPMSVMTIVFSGVGSHAFKDEYISYSFLGLFITANVLIVFNYNIVECFVYIIKLIVNLFRRVIRYKSPVKVKFTTKLKGLLLEIALLPLSAIDSYIGLAFYIFGGYQFTGFITRFFIWGNIKSIRMEKGYSYNVGASDKLVTTTTEHSITDTNGHEIARYQTTEQHVEHDNGERYEVSDQQKLVGWLSPFLIIFRVVSIILSVLSFFSSKFSVSVMAPKTKYVFKDKPFTLLDLIIYEQPTDIKQQSETECADRISY